VNAKAQFKILTYSKDGNTPERVGGCKWNGTATQSTLSIPIAITDLENGEYYCEFVPTALGRYKLEAKTSNGTEMETTNIIVGPDRNMSFRLSGEGLKGGFAGSSPWFKIITTYEQSSEVLPVPPDCFTITILGPDQNEVKANVQSDAPGNFRVDYSAAKAGTYKINITILGRVITPFSPVFEEVPQEEGEVTFTLPAMNLKLKGEDVKITISGGGPGVKGGNFTGAPVTFWLRIVDDKKLPVALPVSSIGAKITGAESMAATVAGTGPGKYDLTYHPTKAEVYYVDLFLGPNSLCGGKPLLVSFAPPQKDVEILFTFPIKLNNKNIEIKLGGIGVKGSETPVANAEFWLRLEDVAAKALFPLSNKNLDVKITDGDGQESKCELVLVQPGSFKCKYNATKLGDYKIDLLLLPPKSSLLGGKAIPVHFGPIEEMDNTPSFTIPINLNLGAGPVALKILLGGVGIRGGVKLSPGKPVKFFIKFKDSNDQIIKNPPLEAPLVGAKITGAETLKTTFTSVTPGDLIVSYTPTKENETYFVDITLNNNSVMGNKPIGVTFGDIPLADPTKCEVIGIRAYPTGNKAAFKIIAKNSAGQQKKTGGDKFTVKITPSGAAGGTDIPVEVIDKRDGEYLVQFTPSAVGKLNIDILLDGKHIEKSPYTSYAMPTTGTIVSLAGAGVVGGHNAKEPVFFLINIMDQEKKPFHLPAEVFDVKINGPNDVSIPVEIVNAEEVGSIKVHYTPVGEGDYKIAITQFGRPITQHTVKFGGKAPLGSFTCTIGGAGIRGGEIGRVLSFYLLFKGKDTRPHDIPLEELSIPIEGPTGPIHPDIVRDDVGKFSIKYKPNEPGDYKIDLLIGGSKILQNPLNAVCWDKYGNVSMWHVFTWNSYHLRICLSGAGIRGGWWSPTSSKFSIKFLSVDDGKIINVPPDQVSVKVHDPDNELVPAEVQTEDDHLNVQYLPPKAGDYQLAVDIGGVPIFGAGKSHKVIFTVPPAFKLSLRGDGLKRAIINKSSTFNISFLGNNGKPIKVPPSILSVHIAGPNGEIPAVLDIAEDQSFDISYSPNVVGDHFINIFALGSRLVPQPIKVRAVYAPEEESHTLNLDFGQGSVKTLISLFGHGIVGGIFTGRPVIGGIKFCDAYGPLTVNPTDVALHLTDEGGHPIDFAVSPHATTPGVFNIRYHPKQVGTYLVNVNYKGKPILPQNHKAIFKPAPQLKISLGGSGLKGGDISEPLQFTITLTDENKKPIAVDEEAIDISFDGPAPVSPEVEVLGVGIIGVNYQPSMIGTYHLKLAFNGKPLTQPLPLKCTGSFMFGIDFPVEPEHTFVFDYPAFHKTKFIVSLGGRGLKSGTLGAVAPIFVKIVKPDRKTPHDIPEDHIKLTIMGPDNKVVPAKVLKSAAGAYVIRYAPIKSGIYDLVLSVENEKIFERSILWEETAIDLNLDLDEQVFHFNFDSGIPAVETQKYKVHLGGPGLKPCRIGQVSPIYVKVEHDGKPVNIPVDQIGFTVRAVHPANLPEAKVKILPCSTHGQFVLRYLPQVEGDYEIDIQLEKAHIFKRTIAWRDPFGAALDIPADFDISFDVPIHFHHDNFKLLAGGPGLREVQLQRSGPVNLRFVHKDNGLPYDVKSESLQLLAFPQDKDPSDVASHTASRIISGKLPGTFVGRYFPTSAVPHRVILKLDGAELFNRIVTCTDVGFDLPLDLEGEEEVFEFVFDPIITEKYKVILSGLGLKSGHIDRVGKIYLKLLDKQTDQPIDIHQQHVRVDVHVDGKYHVPPARIVKPKTPTGMFVIGYLPVYAGKYHLRIDVDHRPVKQFDVEWLPGKSFSHPEHCSADGPGLKKAIVGLPSHFTVTTRKHTKEPITHGGEPVHVNITQPDHQALVPDIHDNNDGTYKVNYTAHHPGRHVILVHVHDMPIGPVFIANAEVHPDPHKCIVSGNALKKTPLNRPSKLLLTTILPTGEHYTKGGIPVQAKFTHTPEPVLVHDNNNGTFDITFTPQSEEPHNLVVEIDGTPIGQSPITLHPKNLADPSKTVITGLEEIGLHIPHSIRLHSPGHAGEKKGGLPITVHIKPVNSEHHIPVDVKDYDNGDYEINFTVDQDVPLSILIAMDDEPVGNSPFEVHPKILPDPSKSKVSGRGIESPAVGLPNEITLTTLLPSGEVYHGEVDIEFDITGPVNTPHTPVVNHKNGTYTTSYVPSTEGEYSIAVKLGKNKRPVKGSPFHIKAGVHIDPKRCTLSGPALEDLTVGEPSHLTLTTHFPTGDPAKSGGENVSAKYIKPADQEAPHPIHDNHDGTYTIPIKVHVETEHDLDIFINNQSIGEPVKLQPLQLLDIPFVVPDIPDIPFETEIDFSGLHIKLGGAGIRGGKHKKKQPFRPIHIQFIDKVKGDHVDVDGLRILFKPRVQKTHLRHFKTGCYSISYKPGTHDTIEVTVILNIEGKPHTVLKEHPIKWSSAKEVDSSSSSGDGGDDKQKKRRRRKRQGKLAHPSHTKVHGPAFDHPELGKPSTLTLTTFLPNGHPCPHGGEYIDVDLIGPDGHRIDVPVTDKQDGTYLLEVPALKVPGSYPLSISLLDGPIKSEPYTIHIPEPEQLIEMPIEVPHLADFPFDAYEVDAPYLLDAKPDQDDNDKKSKFKFSGSGIRGGKIKKRLPFRPILIKAHDDHDEPLSIYPGQFTVSFTPQTTRTKVISIGDAVTVIYKPKDDVHITVKFTDKNGHEHELLKDHLIKWTTHKENTSSSSSGEGGHEIMKKRRRGRRHGKLSNPRECKLHGPAINSPVLGKENTLTLEAYLDGKRNPHGGEVVSAELISPLVLDTEKVPVKDNHDGTYLLSIPALNAPGEYRLVIELLGGEITQPLTVPEAENYVEEGFVIPKQVDVDAISINVRGERNLKVKLGGSGIQGGKLKKRRPFRPIYIKVTDTEHNPLPITPSYVVLEFSPKVKRSAVKSVDQHTLAVFYHPEGNVHISLTRKEGEDDIVLLNNHLIE